MVRVYCSSSIEEGFGATEGESPKETGVGKGGRAFLVGSANRALASIAMKSYNTVESERRGLQWESSDQTARYRDQRPVDPRHVTRCALQKETIFARCDNSGLYVVCGHLLEFDDLAEIPL